MDLRVTVETPVMAVTVLPELTVGLTVTETVLRALTAVPVALAETPERTGKGQPPLHRDLTAVPDTAVTAVREAAAATAIKARTGQVLTWTVRLAVPVETAVTAVQAALVGRTLLAFNSLTLTALKETLDREVTAEPGATDSLGVTEPPVLSESTTVKAVRVLPAETAATVEPVAGAAKVSARRPAVTVVRPETGEEAAMAVMAHMGPRPTRTAAQVVLVEALAPEAPEVRLELAEETSERTVTTEPVAATVATAVTDMTPHPTRTLLRERLAATVVQVVQRAWGPEGTAVTAETPETARTATPLTTVGTAVTAVSEVPVTVQETAGTAETVVTAETTTMVQAAQAETAVTAVRAPMVTEERAAPAVRAVPVLPRQETPAKAVTAAIPLTEQAVMAVPVLMA